MPEGRNRVAELRFFYRRFGFEKVFLGFAIDERYRYHCRARSKKRRYPVYLGNKSEVNEDELKRYDGEKGKPRARAEK